MQHIEQATVFTPPVDAPTGFVEHVRVPTMSVGTYSIPVGGVDDQSPHAEDEVYVVLTGRARFTCGHDCVAATPGTAIFVAAGETHRFHDITEDLAVLVVFAPSYSGSRVSPGTAAR